MLTAKKLSLSDLLITLCLVSLWPNTIVSLPAIPDLPTLTPTSDPASTVTPATAINLSLIDVPPGALDRQLYQLPASVGCNGVTGPQRYPYRVYDFSTESVEPTRSAVILNQVYNTITPQQMWSNSTSAVASAAAITISKPGKYILTGNLLINAQNNNVIGILITANNVTLDLNGYTISQASGSTATGVVGIKVQYTDSNTSLYNITIQNGQLSSVGADDLGGTAIVIGSSSNNTPYYSMNLDTLRITKCGAAGINITEVNDVTIDQVSVTSCTNNNTGNLTLYGLKLSACYNVAVSNASFSDLTCTASSTSNSDTYGIYADGCQKVTFTNCDTSNNTATVADTAAVATVYGTYLYDSTVTTNQNLNFINCRASNNSATVTGTANLLNAGGFVADDAGSSFAKTLTFTNCTANNNSTSTGASSNYAYGFKLRYTIGVTMTNCLASYNSSESGSAIGAYFDRSKSALVQNSSFLSQIANTSTGQDAMGIWVVATDTASTNSHYIVIDNCICAGQSAKNYAYGIRFGDANIGPNRCVVKNCQLYDNLGNDLGSFGFKDFMAAATGSSTLLINNLAYGQGKINPDTGNLNSGLDHANYMIQYNQTTVTQNANEIFQEGTLTAIGAITTTGLGTNYVNVSIIS